MVTKRNSWSRLWSKLLHSALLPSIETLSLNSNGPALPPVTTRLTSVSRLMCCVCPQRTSRISRWVFPYSIDSVIIERRLIVTDLGVAFDTKLSSQSHFETEFRRAYGMLGCVTRDNKEIHWQSDVNCTFQLKSPVETSILQPDVEFVIIKLEECNGDSRVNCDVQTQDSPWTCVGVAYIDSKSFDAVALC